MAKSQMDFTLSPEQVRAIIASHVQTSMIDGARYAASVSMRVDQDGVLVTVTRKRAPRKAKAATKAAA